MKGKGKKVWGWIWDVLEFVGIIAEIILFIPRVVVRLIRDI